MLRALASVGCLGVSVAALNTGVGGLHCMPTCHVTDGTVVLGNAGVGPMVIHSCSYGNAPSALGGGCTVPLGPVGDRKEVVVTVSAAYGGLGSWLTRQTVTLPLA